MKQSVVKSVVLSILFLASLKTIAQCTTPITISVTTVSASCPTCCDGTATITASGGCPPYQYNIAPAFMGGPVQLGLCAGNYTVTVMDAGGCCPPATSSFQLKVANPTGIMEQSQELSGIHILNPIQENIILNLNQANQKVSYEIKIIDLHGKLVYTNEVQVNETQLLIKHHLANGIYYIDVKQSSSEAHFRKKIVIAN